MANPGGVKTRNFPRAVPGGVKTWSFGRIEEGRASEDCVSGGGGRGKYRDVHGDLPQAVLKTQKFEEGISFGGVTVQKYCSLGSDNMSTGKQTVLKNVR